MSVRRMENKKGMVVYGFLAYLRFLMENGNYTLVYILDTQWIRIGSLDLTKITPEKEYPSAYTLPFGIVLAIAGTILTLLPLRRHRYSPRRKKVDKVKVQSCG